MATEHCLDIQNYIATWNARKYWKECRDKEKMIVATNASKSSRKIVVKKFGMSRPTIQRLTMQGMEIMSRHQKLMLRQLQDEVT